MEFNGIGVRETYVRMLIAFNLSSEVSYKYTFFSVHPTSLACSYNFVKYFLRFFLVIIFLYCRCVHCPSVHSVLSIHILVLFIKCQFFYGVHSLNCVQIYVIFLFSFLWLSFFKKHLILMAISFDIFECKDTERAQKQTQTNHKEM